MNIARASNDRPPRPELVVRDEPEARLVRTLPSRTAAALLISFLPACSGTGDGGTGDPHADPSKDALGNCPKISELVGPATWLNPKDEDSLNCKVPADRYVCVSGITVVAVDRYDETGDGAAGNYYAQDTLAEPVPHSGMTIFAPSFSPPDLRLAPGDVTDLAGSLTEFLGPSSGRFGQCRTLPEISGAMSLRFEGAATPAATIKLSELYTYEGARKYLGMLVRLENVAIGSNPTMSSGRYSAPLKIDMTIPAADVPKLSNELFPLQDLGLEKGSTFTSITGVITYFYGFKLAPRSAEDLVP
ncbi:MAG: hypothetical protein HUU21_40585 [Polyangiaceae bacterium]|nr:hypothetical protein [Polyangiaceae bacterium]